MWSEVGAESKNGKPFSKFIDGVCYEGDSRKACEAETEANREKGMVARERLMLGSP